MTPGALLYDPDCGFCRVCIAAVLRWERRGRLRPVPLGSPEAGTLLAGMTEDERTASWHLVIAGRVHSAGAAFAPLFELLPLGRPLARLSARFPRAVERGYRWVADHRSPLGRPVPNTVRRWADAVISEHERGGHLRP